MKKVILVFITIAITITACALNDSTDRKVNPKETKNKQYQSMQYNSIDDKYFDGVMMRNGIIFKVGNGITTILDNNITMSNGFLTKKNDAKMMMKHRRK